MIIIVIINLEKKARIVVVVDFEVKFKKLFWRFYDWTQDMSG